MGLLCFSYPKCVWASNFAIFVYDFFFPLGKCTYLTFPIAMFVTPFLLVFCLRQSTMHDLCQCLFFPWWEWYPPYLSPSIGHLIIINAITLDVIKCPTFENPIFHISYDIGWNTPFSCLPFSLKLRFFRKLPYMLNLLSLQFNLYVFHNLKHKMIVGVLLDLKAFNPTNIEIFVLSHHLWLSLIVKLNTRFL